MIFSRHAPIGLFDFGNQVGQPLDPANARALPALGQFYMQLGEAAKARTVLEQAVQKLPDDAQSHYQLALAYRKLGENEKAKEEMNVFQKLSVRKVAQPLGGKGIDLVVIGFWWS